MRVSQAVLPGEHHEARLPAGGSPVVKGHARVGVEDRVDAGIGRMLLPKGLDCSSAGTTDNENTDMDR